MFLNLQRKKLCKRSPFLNLTTTFKLAKNLESQRLNSHHLTKSTIDLIALRNSAVYAWNISDEPLS